MPPIFPQPDPVPLPAPAALLWGLLLLTFFLHLLPMNFVLGGSIIGALTRASGRPEGHRLTLLTWLGKALPVAIAAAVTLGVAALLFLQVLYGRVFFTSAVLMAVFWISVVPLLIAAYYAAYALALRTSQVPSATAWCVVSSAVTIVAFIYATNMSMMLRPASLHAFFAADARGLQLNLADPSFWPRLLHMLAGAISVAGLAIAWRGVFSADHAFGRWAMRVGSRWFVWGTVVNTVIGAAFLVTLPASTLARFLGGDVVASVLLAAGIALALAAPITAALAAQATDPSSLVKLTTALLVPLLVVMVFIRDRVRAFALGDAGFQPVTWVAPQWGPIAIFAVLLVVAIALTAWMAVIMVRAASAPVEKEHQPAA